MPWRCESMRSAFRCGTHSLKSCLHAIGVSRTVRKVSSVQHGPVRAAPRFLFNARISAPPANNSSLHRLQPEIRWYNGDCFVNVTKKAVPPNSCKARWKGVSMNCPDCGGSGIIYGYEGFYSDSGYQTQYTCSKCQGTGTYDASADACPECGGTGSVRDDGAGGLFSTWKTCSRCAGTSGNHFTPIWG